jgi:hypothetical protein
MIIIYTKLEYRFFQDINLKNFILSRRKTYGLIKRKKKLIQFEEFN